MALRRKKLGEILVDNRLITQAQLDQALAQQQERFEPLGQLLVRAGYISEQLLLRVLAAQLGVAAWHLEKDPPQLEALAKVDADTCRHYQVLPVQIRGDLLLVAMRNPTDIDAIDTIRNLSGLRIEPVLAEESRLARTIDAAFEKPREQTTQRVDVLVSKAMADMEGRGDEHGRQQRSVLTEAETRPVVGLVNQILSDAIEMGASDIHLEPRFDHLEVRYRLDGEMVKIRDIPRELIPMLTARMKIMAELDIVEYRLPQDGRISAQVSDRTVDLRVNVLPNVHGQRIVMRILDRVKAMKKLHELGFSLGNLETFRSMIVKPYGMVLVTGPTGSGKTTTLYAALDELNKKTVNILTCEDPVEYELPGLSQSQVNDKIGLTFASLLRASLRQDPDVILVGEIRDKETAETAIRASLTGHLVLSTLHCNDAPSAVPRLLDMGADPYLLSTCLVGITAQRLVRRLCPHCKQPAEETLELMALREALGADAEVEFFRPVGCAHCFHTGYRGRLAVHELLPVAGSVTSCIAGHAPIDRLRAVGAEYGYEPLQVDAMRRVLAGETSLEEVQRVVFFETWQPQAAPPLRLLPEAA